MRRKNDVSTLRYARSFERLQLRTSGFNALITFTVALKQHKQNDLLHYISVCAVYLMSMSILFGVQSSLHLRSHKVKYTYQILQSVLFSSLLFRTILFWKQMVYM